VSYYFGVFSVESFLAWLKEFDWSKCKLMFVFLTTLVFFYLGFVATTLMLLAGSYRKLSEEGNFCNFKLEVESCFFVSSSWL